MKSKNISVVIIIILFTFYSCPSDDDAFVAQQNLRLSELKEISNGGNTFTFTFDYTDLGQIDKYTSDTGFITEFEYDSAGNTTRIGGYNYTYNNLNQVVSMIKNGGAIHTGAMSYNNEGLLSNFNGIVNNSGSSTLHNYTFNYNALNQITVIDQNITSRPIERILISYDGIGNISEIINQESTDGVNFNTTSTTTYTYDDQPNYAKRILNNDVDYSFYDGFRDILSGINLGTNAFKFEYYGTNNITSVITVRSVGSTTSDIRTITYNNSGYPENIQRELFDEDGDLTFSLGYEFTYESF